MLSLFTTSGVTRSLSQGVLAERGPLATVRGPLTNIQKKTWEMTVNPDVDGYTKTLNHREIFRKMHKSKNLLKTKRI